MPNHATWSLPHHHQYNLDPLLLGPENLVPPLLKSLTQHLFSLEDEEAPRRVLDWVLDTAVLVPVKDLFTVSPEFQKQFRNLTMVKRVTNPSTNLVQVNELSSLDPDAVGRDFGDQVLRNNEGLIVAHHSLPLRTVEARIRSSGRVV